MTSLGQTTFQKISLDTFPVGVVTMEDEDDGTHSSSPPTISTSSDTRHAARLLQVTMAGVGPDEKDVIVGGDTVNPISGDVTNEPAGTNLPSKHETPEDLGFQSSCTISNEEELELQIQRDLNQLSETDLERVNFDLRKVSIPNEDKTSLSTKDGTGSILDRTPSADTKSLHAEIESLGEELLRMLEDPIAQERNPLYKQIAKALKASDNPEDFYANSKAFRTKFLRAEHYDVPKAAKRTADYLCILWNSFGVELLGRPIRLSDLTPSERHLQRKGYQQIFRFRDQAKPKGELEGSKLSSCDHDIDIKAGRRIAGCFDLCRCNSTEEPAIDDETSKTRVLLYLMQVASDDEETQKQGVVFIFMLALRAVLAKAQTGTSPAAQLDMEPESKVDKISRIDSENIFDVGSSSDSDKEKTTEEEPLTFSPYETCNHHNHTRSRVRILSTLFRCGLVRVAAIHVCSPNRSELHEIKRDLLYAFHPLERVRTRFHNGTSMECSLSLNKVGIPTDRLPIKYDGTIKTEDHLQWIAIQEAKESAAKQNKAFEIVECPMNMDVLSGRGQLVRSHPGNVSFRIDFIRARSKMYDMAANREQKNSIADDILKDICTLKRRFLKQHQGAGYWTELDPKTAKEKVMMAFREFRKSQRNQLQQQDRKQRSQTNSQQSQSVIYPAQPNAITASALPTTRSSSVPPTHQTMGGQAISIMNTLPDPEDQFHSGESQKHDHENQQRPEYKFPSYPPRGPEAPSGHIGGGEWAHVGSTTNMFHPMTALHPQVPTIPPYYVPGIPHPLHNPYGYASAPPLPFPPLPHHHPAHHVLPHQHLLSPPADESNSGTMAGRGSSTSEVNYGSGIDSSVIQPTPLNYHHHGMMLPAISTELESSPPPNRRPSSQQQQQADGTTAEDHHGDRRYKRYRTM